MRVERVPLVGGGWIETLVPETPEDIEALERRRDLDDRLSFGDRYCSAELGDVKPGKLDR